MFGPALQEWVREHSDLPGPEVNGRYNLKDYGPDAVLGRDACRVPCQAGTLILFDATLAHGTKPNISARSRAILFLLALSCTPVLREDQHRAGTSTVPACATVASLASLVSVEDAAG
eukprot:TRINITY_DN61779_c0_g1_i1.p1 TRINITY_DN61779_c0_g1~~TRINITY_DN61779_c0_g1_i1.p1  ORF type:complete len:130 (+),score=15.46 TRINITY_DN61779_c0_g1_i1:41-391(+)